MHDLVYQIDGLAFSYTLGRQTVPALSDLAVAVPRGDFVCLSGPSGSGKSTLLNLMGLIETPAGGKLRFCGEDTQALTEKQRNHLRLFRLGFVFQSFNLLPTLNAYENVEYFLVRQGLAAADRRARVEDALAAVGLADQMKKRPMEMSGGQRQRVSIARALAKSPEVILADEPTASLDQKTGRSIVDTLLALNDKYKVTVIIASHDPMVMQHSRRNVRMKDGKILEGVA